MSRDRKPRPLASGRGNAGGTLVGLFVGLLIGIVIAAAVAAFINFGPKPFKPVENAAPGTANGAQTGGDPASLPGKPGDKPLPKPQAKAEPAAGGAQDSKPRFDFYDVLPDGAESLPAPRPPDEPVQEAKPVDKLYLQLGAFQDPADADNLKARLALMGVEASVQRVDSADKGTLHRVRVGPYASLDELAPLRARLSQEGIAVTVVKIKPRDNAAISGEAVH